jgi:hypothetical protein
MRPLGESADQEDMMDAKKAAQLDRAARLTLDTVELRKAQDRLNRERLRRFSEEEWATRPADVVTPGVGSDYDRVAALRVKHILHVPAPAADGDDADMIDQD